MKKLIVVLLMGLLCNYSFSSNRKSSDDSKHIGTIFSNHKANGGYGALSFNYAEIDGKDAFIMGARGSWIIDHSFAIGVGGYGFVNNIDTDHIINNNFEYDLAGGYGGLFLEPIIAPSLPVHISVPILFGIGGIAYIESYNDWSEWDEWYPADDESDVFLVFEPAVELEFNMTRHLRMAASLSYRFTSDIEMTELNPDVMEGYTLGLIFKFGKF